MRYIAELESLPQILADIGKCLAPLNPGAEFVKRIRLAAEEICVNIIKYAYPHEEGSLTVTAAPDGKDHLILRFTDEGIPFNPAQQPDPEPSPSLQEKQIGGLGIHIVKTIADSFRYERDNNTNTLVLRIQIPRHNAHE